MNVIARLRRRQKQRSYPSLPPVPLKQPPTPATASSPTKTANASSPPKPSPRPPLPSSTSTSSSAPPSPPTVPPVDEEARIASALAADVAPAAVQLTPTHPPPPSAAPSTTSSPSDGRDYISFNLQILSDHGIVLCPGFQRGDKAFTSSALLSAIRGSPAASQASQEDFPALKSTSDVESHYSPTLLPPSPDNTAASASSTAPLDELLVRFGQGVFSLADPASAASSASSSSSSSMSVPTQSASAAASSVLKRLSFTGWRSSSSSPAAADASASSFPPASALPPADEEEEDGAHSASSKGAVDEDDDDEVSPPRSPRPSSHVQPVPTSAATSSSTSPISTAPAIQPLSPTPPPSSAGYLAALPASSSPPLLSLPQGLLSSLWSWLMPPTAVSPPLQPVPPTISADSLPPPPPPPYYTRLQRIVVIGVHGWSLLGGMLGEKPLLISTRFCYYIQAALLHFYAQHRHPPPHICCIPLYGHGRIEERVQTYLDTQLPLYAAELQQADHIIVACHSQGCMVTSALLHQLLTSPPPALRLGVGGEDVTVLMLAGLHHGPFPDLSTDLYTSTKELFFYSHSHSQHSQAHMERMLACVQCGVKMMLVGSVHDQVVPLYSSLAHLLGSSPNTLRAVYVDYAHYQPDFLYSLLSLLLFLTNHRQREGVGGSMATGLPSNDVLPHLSGFVRGSLLEKQGGAHSAMHRCVDVYGLGVEWALSGRGVAERERGREGATALLSYSAAMWSSHLSDAFTSGRMNRHLLQLRVREMMERLPTVEGLVAEEERERLQSLFEQWTPKTKNLKVLKDTLQPLFVSGADHRPQLPSSL